MIEEEDVRFESLIIRLDSGREIVVVDRTRNIGMDDGDGYGGGGGTIIDAEAVEVK